jgi:hypothetical protein
MAERRIPGCDLFMVFWMIVADQPRTGTPLSKLCKSGSTFHRRFFDRLQALVALEARSYAWQWNVPVDVAVSECQAEVWKSLDNYNPVPRQQDNTYQRPAVALFRVEVWQVPDQAVVCCFQWQAGCCSKPDDTAADLAARLQRHKREIVRQAEEILRGRVNGASLEQAFDAVANEPHLVRLQEDWEDLLGYFHSWMRTIVERRVWKLHKDQKFGGIRGVPAPPTEPDHNDETIIVEVIPFDGLNSDRLADVDPLPPALHPSWLDRLAILVPYVRPSFNDKGCRYLAIVAAQAREWETEEIAAALKVAPVTLRQTLHRGTRRILGLLVSLRQTRLQDLCDLLDAMNDCQIEHQREQGQTPAPWLEMLNHLRACPERDTPRQNTSLNSPLAVWYCPVRPCSNPDCLGFDCFYRKAVEEILDWDDLVARAGARKKAFEQR